MNLLVSIRGRSLLLALALVLAVWAAVGGSAVAGKAGGGMVRADLRASLDPNREYKVWVYFQDKGPGPTRELPADLLARAVHLSPRALARRARRVRGVPLDASDLPVYAPYVEAVRARAVRLRTVSRWLDAVSARVRGGRIEEIARLPFVRRIDPVAIGTRPMPEVRPAPRGGRGSRRMGRIAPGSGTPAGPPYDYGPGAPQIFLMFSDFLHNAGIDGSTILVCMLDTGFRRDHVAFQGLNVVAERDFINWDPVTRNEPGDPAGQDNHGTLTLGAIAGFEEGQLIGPAFGADFALAKTEIVDQEIRLEEDLWVAGIEWADSLGADVVSSSLGYFAWYSYSDLNGDSAVTTRAADLAAAKGIVVVTAAGNEGEMYWGPGNGGLIAPSDGDSLVAVGAVNDLGQIASFSSRGPTFDGRIKPEVCAMGVSTRTVAPGTAAGYTLASGTSLSTPLVAGVCAQLLQLHPTWTPMQVRDALIRTASQAGSPDNAYGYGVVNAFAAANVESTGIVDPIPPGGAAFLSQNRPNPFSPGRHGATSFQFVLDYQDEISVRIYDVSGRLVRTVDNGIYLFPERPRVATWDGRDDEGRRVASGVYFYRLQTSRQALTRKLILLD